MNKGDNDRIPCHFPWTSVYLAPNGSVKHCCNTNISSLGNLNESSFAEIWNGDSYKFVREKISAGDFEGAHCNPNCEGLRTGKGYPWPEEASGSQAIVSNEQKGRQNFHNTQSIIDHYPLFLQLEFTNNCNLRCVMCFYEFKPPYDIITDQAVEKILDVSGYAKTVALMGGEVFMNKCDLRFIDSYTQEEGATMGFITNGTYLNDHIVEKLKKYKSMWMQISIDGAEKEVYEKVRRKGNWDVVDRNIRQIVKQSRELNASGYNWSISLSYVVMASNLKDLPNAIAYATGLNIPIGFYPVKGFHLLDENIFVYSKVRNFNSDWRSILDKSYELLELNKNTYSYAKSVLLCLDDIKNCLEGPKINRPPRWLFSFARFLFRSDADKKAQGLSVKDRKTGHLIELYYNWRTGGLSLKSILKYVFFKMRKRFRKN
ncbi:MAG: radical SAM protein [Bacteroidales bacterium]